MGLLIDLRIVSFTAEVGSSNPDSSLSAASTKLIVGTLMGCCALIGLVGLMAAMVVFVRKRKKGKFERVPLLSE